MTARAAGWALLPREIRDEIYRHHLFTWPPRPRTLPDPQHRRLDRYDDFDPQPGSSLFLVSRQIRKEYMEAFYTMATLKTFIRLSSFDLRLFEPSFTRYPVTVLSNVQSLSVTVGWKPRSVYDSGVAMVLRHNLTDLTEVSRRLPALRRLVAELRYYDIHDLDDDISESRFDPAVFFATRSLLPIKEATLHLSAVSTLMTWNGQHELDVPEDSPEYYLMKDSYVCWRFTPTSRQFGTWHGLACAAALFFCCGEEADTMESLEALVRRKWDPESPS